MCLLIHACLIYARYFKIVADKEVTIDSVGIALACENDDNGFEALSGSSDLKTEFTYVAEGDDYIQNPLRIYKNQKITISATGIATYIVNFDYEGGVEFVASLGHFGLKNVKISYK